MVVWYVYVLLLSNSKYYVWSTRNFVERIDRHARWWVKSMGSYLPFIVKICKQYPTYNEAYAIERTLKKSKSKLFVERYIQENS